MVQRIKSSQSISDQSGFDDDLYTIHTDLDITTMKAELQGTNTGANFGDNFVYAEAMVQTLLYAREDYKGTGTQIYTAHIIWQM